MEITNILHIYMAYVGLYFRIWTDLQILNSKKFISTVKNKQKKVKKSFEKK